MSIKAFSFSVKDHKKDCYRIHITDTLLAGDAEILRQIISESASGQYDVIYIDVKDVLETDLSGINEVINAHYALKNAAKELVFLYKKESVIEKWVETTGLHKFVATAIVPAD